jgi:protein tyrosine phosphatase (PTP) superfamily phosphohydrolase (DUF442 family)
MDDRRVQGISDYRRLSARIATAGQPDEGELAAVAEAGYQVVINLGLHDAPYALEDEAGLVRSLGMAYVHIPVVWERPTRDDLERFFETMAAHQDERLFVHCAANKRVSAFMALYRVHRLGWPVEEALATLAVESFPEAWRRFIRAMLEPGNGPGAGSLRA